MLNTNKIIKIGYWSLLGIIVVVILHFLIFQFSGLEDGLAATAALGAEEKIAEISNLGTNWQDFILTTPVILLVLGAIVAICFSLYQMVTNALQDKNNRNRLLVVLGLSVIIFVASFLLASPSVPYILGLIEGSSANGLITDPTIIAEWGSTVKWLEAGLYMTYTVSALIVISILSAGIMKFFK